MIVKKTVVFSRISLGVPGRAQVYPRSCKVFLVLSDDPEHELQREKDEMGLPLLSYIRTGIASTYQKQRTLRAFVLHKQQPRRGGRPRFQSRRPIIPSWKSTRTRHTNKNTQL